MKGKANASTRCSSYILNNFSDFSWSYMRFKSILNNQCLASLLTLSTPVIYRTSSIMRVFIVRMRDKRKF